MLVALRSSYANKVFQLVDYLWVELNLAKARVLALLCMKQYIQMEIE